MTFDASEHRPVRAEDKNHGDVERDASKIVELLAGNQSEEAAKAIADELHKLSHADYSKLLDRVEHDSNNFPDGDAPYPPSLVLGKFNTKTDLYDSVQIVGRGWPDNPPIRIVQEDNTLSGIAVDRFKELRAIGGGVLEDNGIKRITGAVVDNVTQEIAKQNSIKDANRIKPGQIIEFPF